MLSGRRKRDYAQESAAESLVVQATKFGVEPADPEAALAETTAESYDDATEEAAESEAVAA